MDRARLGRLMEGGVRDGVFPGGVLLAARGNEPLALLPAGRLAYDDSSPRVSPETVYDLASLTKVLSTTLLTMIFVDRGRLALDARLADLQPEPVPPDKREITIAHLLSHSSGLPAWRPYYRVLENMPPRERRAAAARLVIETGLEGLPGRSAVYSDLNFIILGLILEKIGGAGQDALFRDLAAHPLGLADIGYRPKESRAGGFESLIAPTETGPRRSGPVGSPLGEPRGGVPIGMVHDDNAAALGGVAGHAGLFGTAPAVWRVFDSMRRAFRGNSEGGLVSPETVRRFWRRAATAPDSTWALGFDTPSPADSSAGRLFSRNSVGHLGFTGTSLWHDPEADLTVALLTNRVHPSAENQAIRDFRPRLHDAVYEELAVSEPTGDPADE